MNFDYIASSVLAGYLGLLMSLPRPFVKSVVGTEDPIEKEFFIPFINMTLG